MANIAKVKKTDDSSREKNVKVKTPLKKRILQIIIIALILFVVIIYTVPALGGMGA